MTSEMQTRYFPYVSLLYIMCRSLSRHITSRSSKSARHHITKRNNGFPDGYNTLNNVNTHKQIDSVLKYYVYYTCSLLLSVDSGEELRGNDLLGQEYYRKLSSADCNLLIELVVFVVPVVDGVCCFCCSCNCCCLLLWLVVMAAISLLHIIKFCTYV